jgi:hypothetical protein
LVCDSCKRKLKHVQTCLSTRVCLTQHPSDTLQLSRELNCRTSCHKYSYTLVRLFVSQKLLTWQRCGMSTLIPTSVMYTDICRTF